MAINVSSYCIEGYKFNDIHKLSGLWVHEWCCVVMVGVLSSTHPSCVCVCACVCVLTQLTQFKLSHGHLPVHRILNHPFHPICVHVHIRYYGMLKYTPTHSSPPPAVPPGGPENLDFPSIGPYSVIVTWDPPTDDGGLQQLASSTAVSTPFLQYIQYLLYRWNFLYFAFCCEPFVWPVGTALCCALCGPRRRSLTTTVDAHALTLLQDNAG